MLPSIAAEEVTKIDFHGSRVTTRGSDGSVHEFEAPPEILKDLNIGDCIEPRRRPPAPTGRERARRIPVSINGKTGQIKGTMKQATGVLTGDKPLEREGKTARAVGNIKEKTQKLTEDIQKKTGLVLERAKSMSRR